MLDEFKFGDYESTVCYKEKMMKLHEDKILKREREIRVEVLFLRYNSRDRLFIRKTQVQCFGTVYSDRSVKKLFNRSCRSRRPFI